MPKTKISEYSATNSANTDIEGINIDEGCAPSGINNAIRELMVHLKEFQTGASGDAFTFAGGTLMSGTNTISGAAIISGNINSSGTNTFSGSNFMSFSGGSSASPSIYFASDTNTGIFSPAADTIAFTEGGAESMRIDSSGNVGIGTTSPGRKLQVSNTAADPFISIIGAANNEGGLLFGDNASDAAGQIRYMHNGDYMYFNTNGSERMRIDSSGNLLVGITSARANAGDVQVSKGISFPATQSAQSDANTLDDYEEGTWTPTVTPASGSLTAYTSSGRYTKIGRVVSLYLKFTITTPGTASGQAAITGIPFNGESTSQFIGVCRESNTTGTIYFTNLSTSTVYLQNSTNGGISWTASYTYECNIVYTI